jgi:microcystin-dependent protein
VLPLSGSFASSVRVYSGVASGARGNGGSINTTSVVAFTVPDLRGRFPFGQIATAGSVIPDPDATTLSTILYDYPMASWGGEERHSLTTAEMPAHDHNLTGFLTALPTSGGGMFALNQGVGAGPNNTYIEDTGSNTPHNNMPPYLAVRYIIKAKPYTRAAIIDGIDLPYNSLLVRDLRTRNVGGSNNDLVFLTNTSGDSGSGTERMRLTRNGLKIVQDDGYTLGIELIGAGSNPGTATPTATAPYLKFYNPETTQNRYTWWSPRDNYALAIEVSHDSLGAGSAPYSSGGQGITGCFYITQFGDVGVMKNSPGATLDVNGTLRVGDFGGSTNVMAKATNANLTVGQVVPLLRGQQVAAASGTLAFNQTSICLPAGTWFVYMTASDNSIVSSANVDEDVHFTMAKVWTVPTGQFLRFGCIGKTPTATNTTLGYWMDSSSALKTSSDYSSFKEFATNASGDQTAWDAAAATPLQITSSGTGPSVIYSAANADGPGGLINYAGYAIRIA